MGKITIFAIDGCPFCVKAKQNLTDRQIPYTEINLTSHPDKRSDMLALSDSLTVPQIFFNEKHVGGANELIKLLEQWDGENAQNGTPTPLKRYEEEVKGQPDPSDPRLQPSTLPAAKEPTPPPRNEDDKIKIPNSGNTVSVLDITDQLLKVLPSSDLNYLTTTYKNAFQSKDLLDSLMKEFSLDEEQAAEFGKYLQKRKIFDHVTSDHIFGQNIDKKLFWRLQPYQKPNVLNSFRIWEDRIDPDSMAVVSRLNKIMQGIQKRATNRNGDFDLASASNDGEYVKFQEGVCELQGIDMSVMDVNTRTAFIINVYNLMIKYAQVKHGVPRNNLERVPFFTKIKINIGGEKFSFNDLENGILRANAAAPYALKRNFAGGDKRTRLSLQQVDNRIHFALNCGAKSCPPVKKFTSTDLEEELRIVALAFCEQDDNVKLEPILNEIYLNTIFNWYRQDFAKTNGDLPKVILGFLRGEKKEMLEKMINKKSVKVKFNTYDWSSSVVNSKTFDASALKRDTFILLK